MRRRWPRILPTRRDDLVRKKIIPQATYDKSPIEHHGGVGSWTIQSGLIGKAMARPLRIDYADAYYHATYRDHRRGGLLGVFAMTQANMRARKARPDLHGG
jgi:hypothetical protein